LLIASSIDTFSAMVHSVQKSATLLALALHVFTHRFQVLRMHPSLEASEAVGAHAIALRGLSFFVWCLPHGS
jgi:hypothetical protein